ncbi:MAG: potassium transporter Kup [Alphaproteobacteria bacterium]|nr:potassium transporter Kup [Alphaproteobacteria bacterium]
MSTAATGLETESDLGRVPGLALAALGVVFGDIGTSPLYAIKETFGGAHPLPIDQPHILGVLSLVFWSIMSVVSLKYVLIVMRADNRGEGGSLALLASVTRMLDGKGAKGALVTAMGLFAAGLFYGDSMITPAISVLSAIEGLDVAKPGFSDYILPLTLLILIGLFAIQRHGTATVGTMFGPIVAIWFITLAVIGIKNIGLAPGVLWALSPHHAVLFLINNGLTGFLSLGAVVLVLTGAEALYADMGHFGRLPIALAWYGLALPGLLINYFGQGALLLTHPEAIENPFFLMVPAWGTLPLVILATMATVIASQAVISGAFSMTRQAIQLGYLPRLRIIHTSQHEKGQIYIPFVNWALMLSVAALVASFGSSSKLAAAYGVAVTGTMAITAIMVGIVMRLTWKWQMRTVILLVGFFLMFDMAFFLANIVKIEQGGWFPLVIGLVIFTLLVTWKSGRAALLARTRRDSLPIKDFLATLSSRLVRVPGTAIFLSGSEHGVPLALLHNIKHNKILHERVVILTVIVDDVPYVTPEWRVESRPLEQGFHQVLLHYGFMQDPDVPKALAQARSDELGFFYEPMSISYFLSRETVIPSANPALPLWQAHLYASLARMAATAMDFFRLPINRVVELGGQVEI